MVKFKEKMRYTSQAIREVIAQGQVDNNVNIKIDLKVGEYVRLRHWGISKCIKIENGLYTFDKLNDECWSGDLPNVIYECELDDMVKEKSTKKINLLAIGDYVNGEKIIDLYNPEGKEVFYIILNNKEMIKNDSKIKRILTQEQFKNNEYKEV